MEKKFPRIYCLSIPGTDRMKFMKEQFEKLGLQYEFVHGKIYDSRDVPFEKVKDCWVAPQLSNPLYNVEFRAARIYGCLQGHIDLLEKAIADDNDYIISCEDDILLGDGFKESILNIMQDLDGKLDGICNICGTWFGRVEGLRKGNEQYVATENWNTDSAYLLNKAGMQYYLAGLRQSCKESDTGMSDYNKTNNRKIYMAAPEVTTVTLNP